MQNFLTDLVKFDQNNKITRARQIILEADDMADAREQAAAVTRRSEWVLFRITEISDDKVDEIVKREDDALADAGYALI